VSLSFCMKIMRPTPILALPLAVFLLACGSSDPAPTPTTPTTTPDTTAPTLVVTSGVPEGSNATGSVNFTFSFSEPIDPSFTTAQVTVTGGTKGAFTWVNTTTGILTVAPPATATGTIAVVVTAGAFKDVAGNVSTTGGSISQPYDTTGTVAPPVTGAPTVAITSNAGAGSVASGDVTFTFTFSEPITTGFTKSSIKVTGGTAGTFARVSSTVSTLVVTPEPCVGSMSVIVPAGAFTGTTSATVSDDRFWANQPYALPLPSGTTKSPKRGVGGDISTIADLTALSPGLSWWYNWGTDRNAAISTQQATDAGMDYLPMIWGSDFTTATMEAKIAAMPGLKYLLVMNEPNFSDQSRTSPVVAAAQWPKFEALAEKYNLQLVGPAMGFSGDPNYGDPVIWLDEFYAAYRAAHAGRDPQIDALAIHWYDYGFDSYVKKFLRYGRPLWVTEMNNWHKEYWWNIDSQSKQVAEGIKTFVPFCENNSNIARYAWFIVRSFPDPSNASLLAETVVDPANGNAAVTTDGNGHNLFKADGDINSYKDLGLQPPKLADGSANPLAPGDGFPLLDAHGLPVMNDPAYAAVPKDGQLTTVGTSYVHYAFNSANAPTFPMGPAPLPTLPLNQMTVLTSRVAVGWPIWSWGGSTNSTCGFTPATESLSGDGGATFRITFSDGGGTGGYVVIDNFYWPIDMTTLSKLHLDYWTGDGATLKVKVLDGGADGVIGGTDDTNLEQTITVTKKGAWQGVDLDFSTLAHRSKIRQITLWCPAVSTWYLDNIYCKQ